MYDIIIGRTDADREKFGTEGTIFVGKHYVQMGRTTSLSNKVYLDVNRSHVIFVCGKRGSGKSYSLGVITEGISDLPNEIKQNISVIILDTMGIFWTMKYPNQKDRALLDEWELKGKALDVKIYTPVGFHKQFKEKGIPTDFPFSIKPSEPDSTDWCTIFGVALNEPLGVFIERIISKMKEEKETFEIKDILDEINKDKEADINTKNAAKNRFLNAQSWGIFDKKGTPISDLAKGGQVTILDISCYATIPNSWNIKSLVIGLISEKLFIERMIAKKNEEYAEIHSSLNYFSEEESTKHEVPLVWLVIDEAHEFLPNTGKTLATDPLITILREGRQPGISLILASQQPGKIHSDVMTQSDTVISHRITAKIDTEALGALMQSYMREGLTQQLDELPRVKGAAIVFDDTNERMYSIRLRPRFTWHGGEDPSAVNKKEERFKL